MNKISSLAAALLFGAFSTVTLAAQLEGSGVIRTIDCLTAPPPAPAVAGSQLSNDVSVNLSTGVKAAYVCDIQKPAPANTNFVYIGTCSTNGSVKSRTIACTWGPAAAGTARPKSDKNCVDVDGGATPPTGAAAQVTGSGATVYTANSGGGNVSAGFASTIGALCSAPEVETTITEQAS